MKQKLIEARELAFSKADEIVKLVEAEKRTMTEEEQKSLRGYHAEMDKLDADIALAEKQEQLRKDFSKKIEIPAVHGNERSQDLADKKVIKQYNILKALRHLSDPINNPLEGVEKEMDQEARKEQREVGVSNLVTGGINIPAMAIRANEQVAGVDGKGGFTIGSDLVEVIGILRPRLAVRQAGARILTGLVGNLDFTTQSVGAATNWVTEIATSAQTGQTYTQASMSPNRLAAWTPISLQLLAQSSIDMQQFAINDLNDAMNYAIENAAINGTGVAPIPLGALGTVPELGIGTNGGAMTYDQAVLMETALSTAETDFGKLAYLINSKTYGKLKRERTDSGSGIFSIAQDSNLLNGKRVFVSNVLPDDLDKGTSTGVCSAALYGNFNDMLIGNWGGANLVVDNVTSAKEGMINIVVNTFWDILFRRLTSFVSTSDILTT